MNAIDSKTSVLIPSQLPEFIRDNPDYSNFVTFLQAYYEWMEQENGVLYNTKNLLNYDDIDRTTNEFLEYFTNDFLPYFPKDALVDKKLATKVAKELYQTKGTPASYQFLFRTLYNSDFDLFYTKDAVLKASAGIWYVAKSLRLASNDPNFLSIDNYRLFGETSKSIAVVENSLYNGTKTEVFISNIERLFQSGEFVRVVDSNNQDVLFNGHPLRAKIVGQISQIKINPNFRGLLYQVGDPVIVYDGLNSNTGIGATATVGSVTSGSIQRINVLTGGYGYRLPPNTTISFTNAPGATAIVGSLDPDPTKTGNVAFVPSDTITLKRFIQLSNTDYHFVNFPNANINTKLSDAFTMQSFATYPISSVIVTNGGGGITQTPTVLATSTYSNDALEIPNLASLGILGPIQITTGGQGYLVNDKIVFNGGSGYGAFANVTSVAANGQILNIEYVAGNENFPTGGMGYRSTQLPILTVHSSNVQAHGAEVYVDGILGAGATFAPITNRVGSITTINVSNYGEDYIATPNVSLKIQDIVVTGVNIGNLPLKGDIVYQGTSPALSTYLSYFESIELLQPSGDPALSIYRIRVYNYNSNPVPTSVLKINDKSITFTMADFAYDDSYDSHGVKHYGDGTAKATATFLNGLTISGGQYLNTYGQPSSFNVLQSKIYNNYTYEITVNEAIAKYRNILLNLLHPTGMQLIGRYALKSETKFNSTAIAIEQPRIGGDDPLNAAEPDATAWVLMDGPYGDPFYGGQSWRKMRPATITNGKTDYIYGDERVYWDGLKWIYFNTMGLGEISYGTGGLYPWLARWTGHFSAAKIYSTYAKSTNYPAIP
jgi:hypothetical protein